MVTQPNGASVFGRPTETAREPGNKCTFLRAPRTRGRATGYSKHSPGRPMDVQSERLAGAASPCVSPCLRDSHVRPWRLGRDGIEAARPRQAINYRAVHPHVGVADAAKLQCGASPCRSGAGKDRIKEMPAAGKDVPVILRSLFPGLPNCIRQGRPDARDASACSCRFPTNSRNEFDAPRLPDQTHHGTLRSRTATEILFVFPESVRQMTKTCRRNHRTGWGLLK